MQESTFLSVVCMKKIIIFILLLSICVFSGCDKKTQLNNIIPNRTVACVINSDDFVAAKEYSDSISAEIVEYSSEADAVIAVENGKADYVVLDEYEGQAFVDAGSAIEQVEKCKYKNEYRACFSINDKELCDKFNEALRELSEDGTLEKIKNSNKAGESYVISNSPGVNGTLIMACDPIFENRVFRDSSGELRGTDVDIAKAVCAHLGYDVEFIDKDFQEMFSELDNGNADFVMSSVEYNETRSEYYLFSDVYSTLEYNVYERKIK